MRVLTHRSPNQKPQPGVQIDWSNPDSRGLVESWALNEGAGTGVRGAARGTTGYLTGFPAGYGWRPTPTGRGTGLLFNGSTSAAVIAAPAGSPLDITGMGGITWGGTVYPLVSNVYQLIAGKMSTSPARQYAVYLSANGTGTVFVALAGSTQAGSGGANFAVSPGWTVGAWNRILVTYDGAFQKIYINGALSSSVGSTGAITHQTGDFYLGYAGAGGDSFPLNGYLSDSPVYNRALSADEVQRDYRGYLSLYRQDRRNVFAVAQSAVLFRRSLFARAGSRSLNI